MIRPQPNLEAPQLSYLEMAWRCDGPREPQDPKIGSKNGRNTVNREHYGEENSLSLTEFWGKLGEFCAKLGEFALAHK